ncbi:MAG: hypothetical protein BIFFINMI_01784 [Phycisphaerae bacterium]|nr:hypothetical protein [Phycisphaerae bacterium]
MRCLAAALILWPALSALADAPAVPPPPPTTQADVPTTQPDPPPERPQVAPFRCRMIGNIEKTGFPEPSGIVFHPRRKTLFVISDESGICEMNTDGRILRRREFPTRYDCEGVTVNPATGLLYLAAEGKEQILEVDPDKLDILRVWQIPRTYKGELVMRENASTGIEAITFVPDAKHPQGGTFLVANQSFSLTQKDDRSAVFRLEVPLRHKGPNPPAVKILNMFEPGVTDLAGLHWDAKRGRLYILSDSNHILMESTIDGRLYARWTQVPGKDTEGVTIDPDGNLYFAQDCGGVIKVKWLREEASRDESTKDVKTP